MGLSPLDLALTTLKDLSGNLVRSGLTTLGIFMGVAAVNATLNVDAITSNLIQQKLAERDSPYVGYYVFSRDYDRPPPPPLEEAELQQLQREVSGIREISQVSRLWIGDQVTHEGAVAEEVTVVGVSGNYQSATGRRMVQGRFFEPSDYDKFRPVAIIDTVLAEKLFSGASALEKGLFISGSRFTVIGVTESKDNFSFGEPTGELWLTDAYGNLMQGTLSPGNNQQLQMALSRLEAYQQTHDQLKAYLERLYPGYQVYVYSNAEDLYKEARQQANSAFILKVVGILSLVVGGVGIANITIAAVVERTREIGLRRAIGATDLEVMAQFIAEAAILSLVGGAAAVVAVHFLTQTATRRVFEVPYAFRTPDAALSMGAAFVVGVGSSFLPALRVVRIDVVQALRGE